MTPTRRGFTLTEFLVVIAIIALLVGLLLPSTRRIKEAAPRMSCSNNLKQLMFGMHNYHDTHQSFPSGCIGPGSSPSERLSLFVELLPYLEQGELYKRFNTEQGYTGSNEKVAGHPMRTLQCPNREKDEKGTPNSNYIAMAGIGYESPWHQENRAGNGVTGYNRHTSVSQMVKHDGVSNTIVFLETRYDVGPWAQGGFGTTRGYDPTYLPFFGDKRPFAGHEKGMNAAMGDGAVRFIPSDTNPQHLAAMITVNGGESNE